MAKHSSIWVGKTAYQYLLICSWLQRCKQTPTKEIREKRWNQKYSLFGKGGRVQLTDDDFGVVDGNGRLCSWSTADIKEMLEAKGYRVPEVRKSEEGYEVTYKDGYKSWCPKDAFEEFNFVVKNEALADTAPMMVSPDYKDCFKAEFYQLYNRYNALKGMIEKWDANALEFTPTCSRGTYDAQLKAMGQYLLVLEQRARVEGVSLQYEGDDSFQIDFGDAVNLLKAGFRVARKGWNGKGMFLWLKPAATVKSDWCKDSKLKELVDKNGGEMEAVGTICMKTADNKILTGWLASQTDILATDWVLVD